MRAAFVGLLVVCLIILVVFTTKTSTRHIKQDFETVGKAKTLYANVTSREVESALQNYFNDHNEYPTSLTELVPQYLSSADKLNDAWNNPLQLERTQDGLALVSAGPDAQFGTADDIRRRIQ
jgi:hypothetical protein